MAICCSLGALQSSGYTRLRWKQNVTAFVSRNPLEVEQISSIQKSATVSEAFATDPVRAGIPHVLETRLGRWTVGTPTSELLGLTSIASWTISAAAES